MKRQKRSEERKKRRKNVKKPMSKYSVLTSQPIMLGELDKAVLIIKTLGIHGSAQI